METVSVRVVICACNKHYNIMLTACEIERKVITECASAVIGDKLSTVIEEDEQVCMHVHYVPFQHNTNFHCSNINFSTLWPKKKSKETKVKSISFGISTQYMLNLPVYGLMLWIINLSSHSGLHTLFSTHEQASAVKQMSLPALSATDRKVTTPWVQFWLRTGS